MSGLFSDIEFLFNAAVRFHQQGNLQRASELYDRVQEISPQHAMSLNNQALIAKAVGRLDLSWSMLQEARQCEPENFEILANLGRVALQKGDSAVAFKHLCKALEIRPDDRNLQMCLARSLFNIGRHGRARAILKGLVRNDTKCAETYYLLGLIALEENADMQASGYFQQALRLNPDHAGALKQVNGS